MIDTIDKPGGVSDKRGCAGSDKPFKIRLYVKGEDSGCYVFSTQEEADEHYDWSTKNLGALRCCYKKEYPNDLHHLEETEKGE